MNLVESQRYIFRLWPQEGSYWKAERVALLRSGV